MHLIFVIPYLKSAVAFEYGSSFVGRDIHAAHSAKERQELNARGTNENKKSFRRESKIAGKPAEPKDTAGAPDLKMNASSIPRHYLIASFDTLLGKLNDWIRM